MQVGGDVKCMGTILVGMGISGFGDIATSISNTFERRAKISLLDHWTIVHGCQKI